MDSQELKKWLKRRGCTFETKKRGSGHLIVHYGERVTELPMHGKGKELPKGLEKKIKKDLGLEDT